MCKPASIVSLQSEEEDTEVALCLCLKPPEGDGDHFILTSQSHTYQAAQIYPAGSQSGRGKHQRTPEFVETLTLETSFFVENLHTVLVQKCCGRSACFF